MRIGAVLTVAAIVAFAMMSGLAQTPTTQKPSFEVALIKPFSEPAPGQPRVSARGYFKPPGGRFNAVGVTLKGLIAYAYQIRDFQVVGGPEWINAERWEIAAKAADGAVPFQTGSSDPNAPDPVMVMIQSLIDERFQLKAHRESRELPVYELVVATGGAKIQLSEDQTPPKPREPGSTPPPRPLSPSGPRGSLLPPPHGGMNMKGGPSSELQANAVPLSTFVNFLSRQLRRTVIDKTELAAGRYDIRLVWAPEPEQGSAPSNLLRR